MSRPDRRPAAVKRRWAILAGFASLMVAVGCASTPEPPSGSSVASLMPVKLAGGAAGVERAVLTEALVPRTGDSPNGPELVTDPDGHPEPLDPGRKVVILSDPKPGPD